MPWKKQVTQMLKEGQFFIDEEHIVNERPWRGILFPHVHQVLKAGTLASCTETEAHWRGDDCEGRTLELALRPFGARFESLPTWTHAAWVCVKTAYEPDGKKNDTKRQKQHAAALVSKRTPRRTP